jgi:mono/diheme cytochrome c family protein
MLDAKREMAPATGGCVMLRVIVCSILLLPATAFAQDVDRGRQLSARWCAGCHVVDRSPKEARADGTPTFPAIAAKPGISTEHLRAAMNPTHGRMPDLALSKRDQDDLVAYIFSLR